MNPLTNNYCELKGKSLKDFKKYHTTLKERFFSFNLDIERRSGEHDILPIIISEKLLTPQILTSDFLSLSGQIRTFNKYGGKVEIYFFVKDIEINDEEIYHNEVNLKGFICKKGNYRSTYSNRKVMDFIIAVNRLFKKSDYLPIISWGKDAKYISNLDVSTELEIKGRFQSRKYIKKINEEEKEEKMAYEISSSQILLVNNNLNSQTELGLE